MGASPRTTLSITGSNNWFDASKEFMCDFDIALCAITRRAYARRNTAIVNSDGKLSWTNTCLGGLRQNTHACRLAARHQG